ncbi:hypothetical protein COOONC_15803, partial [Cooperia oncophora]
RATTFRCDILLQNVWLSDWYWWSPHTKSYVTRSQERGTLNIQSHSTQRIFEKKSVLDAIKRLQSRAFAGGTVKQILVDEFYSVLRESIEERLEHGTLNYYAICALSKGFDDLKRYGGMQKISASTMKIANEAFEMLSGRVHWNGKPAVKIYGWENARMQGPIVTFNLLRDDGSFTGYSESVKWLLSHGLEIFRTERWRQRMWRLRWIVIYGKPTGAVRVSFGRQSTSEDVHSLEQMIDYCFLDVHLPVHIDYHLNITNYTAIVHILLFTRTLKACAGIAMTSKFFIFLHLQSTAGWLIELSAH